MSKHDPRILIRAFDILNEEFNRFNQISSDTLKEAEHTQKCTQERINQANRATAISLNQSQSDAEDVEEVDTEIRGLLSNYSDAVEIAYQTLEKVNQVSQQAQTTLSVWQNELQKALAWQARAEERLARAIQEYERAQRNLASAKQNLASAESSLRSCMSDPERKSCSGEEQTHNNARAAVVVALEKLQIAEMEVRAAEEELERARARVRCCQQAVDYSQQAVQHANLATEQANQAFNEAERSLESAESANRAITKASTNATEENELVQQAINQVQQAEGIVTQSQVSVQIARSKADSAYNLAVCDNQELAYRRDQLVRLNQVDSSLSPIKPDFETGNDSHNRDIDEQTGNDSHNWDIDEQTRRYLNQLYDKNTYDENTAENKKYLSQYLGEAYGHKMVCNILGYTPILSPEDKYESFPQGLDGIYLDSEETIVVTEFKGQGSSLSGLQKKKDYPTYVCTKIVEGKDFPYRNVPQEEREFAKQILREIENGADVRYEVYRTKFDPELGELSTSLEKRDFPEANLSSKNSEINAIKREAGVLGEIEGNQKYQEYREKIIELMTISQKSSMAYERQEAADELRNTLKNFAEEVYPTLDRIQKAKVTRALNKLKQPKPETLN